jgi:hypothetical protein
MLSLQRAVPTTSRSVSIFLLPVTRLLSIAGSVAHVAALPPPLPVESAAIAESAAITESSAIAESSPVAIAAAETKPVSESFATTTESETKKEILS